MPPEIKKLWSKKNAVIFVWPGEEHLQLMYDGTLIVVPPRDVVARPGQGARWTHKAAERDGKLVPGTAVVEDVTVLTPEGGYKTVLNIDHVCRYLTKDRDDLFTQGFNIVENVGMVAEAMALGIPLYNESQTQRARDVLARELARQRAYKERGETAPPSTSEHLIEWAIKHLKNAGPQAQAHKAEDIEAVLAGKAVAAAATVIAPEDVIETGSPEAAEAAVAVLAGAEAFREARSLNVGLGNFELQALLSGSADAIAKVRVKIEAKKRENAVKEAEAAAQPA